MRKPQQKLVPAGTSPSSDGKIEKLNRKRRISLVSGDPAYTSQIEEILRALPQFDLVACYNTGVKALDGLPKTHPEIALLDFILPDMPGTDCIQRVRVACPSIKFLLLMGHPEALSSEAKAIVQGTSGCLIKPFSPAQLISALEFVSAGGVAWSDGARSHLLSAGGVDADLGRLFSKDNLAHSRLDRIADWASRAVSSQYRIGKLAKACAISPSQLRRHFLTKFGKTPQQWMDDLRLGQAANLLRTSNLTVKEIAAKLNYDYPGNFARQFKRRYRCSPSDYATQRTGSPIGSDLSLDRSVGI